jgi:hypothetical protein
VTQSRLHDFEAVQRLEQMRDDAIRRGDVPADENSEYVVRRLMSELVGSAGRAEATALECGDLSPLSDFGMAKTNDTETAMSWSTPKSESGDESPHSKGANEPAIINDISAEPAGEEAANIDATDCPEATSGNAPAANSPAAGANIREIFSQVPVAYGGAEETMTGKLATGRWAERMEPAAWGVR